MVAVCFRPVGRDRAARVAWSFRDQGTRPLQIESAGASLWLAAHQLIGLHLKTFFSHGSDNLYGHPPTTAASIMTIVQWVAIVGVWVTYALGRATRERLLLASAATVCAFLFLGRVLSPQYLIWLVPLVMIAPGRRGFAAVGLLALAMMLTQVWFPQHFLAAEGVPAAAVVGRDRAQHRPAGAARDARVARRAAAAASPAGGSRGCEARRRVGRLAGPEEA